MAITYLLTLAFFIPILTLYTLIAVVIIWGYGFAKPNYEQHRAMVMRDKMASQMCVTENRKQGGPSPRSRVNQQQKADKRGLLPLHNFEVTERCTAHSSWNAKRYKQW
jgi:hypothetical protein